MSERDELHELPDVARILELPYERLLKQRQRNPSGFPTEHVGGRPFHRPTAVADFQRTISRGRPRSTRDTI